MALLDLNNYLCIQYLAFWDLFYDDSLPIPSLSEYFPRHGHSPGSIFIPENIPHGFCNNH